MNSYTAKSFHLKMGQKPKNIFDLTKHLTTAHKIDCMNNPTCAIVRAEFGTLVHKDFPPMPYCLMVAWWITDGIKPDDPLEARIRGRIDSIILFKDQAELERYRVNVQLRAKNLNHN